MFLPKTVQVLYLDSISSGADFHNIIWTVAVLHCYIIKPRESKKALNIWQVHSTKNRFGDTKGTSAEVYQIFIRLYNFHIVTMNPACRCICHIFPKINEEFLCFRDTEVKKAVGAPLYKIRKCTSRKIQQGNSPLWGSVCRMYSGRESTQSCGETRVLDITPFTKSFCVMSVKKCTIQFCISIKSWWEVSK